ncbi:MAG: hypothetical protein IJ062_13140 [Firmicutes bacterium]|nr:hypothetical protein [Bacillota bacterium]
MEPLIPDLETVYGIRPRSMIKSKYFYIINSDGRFYRFYPMTEGAEQCGRLAELNRALCGEKISVCPIVKTLDGEDFSVLDEQFFMLTRVPKGRTPALENSADVLAMAGLLGRFHRGLKKFPVQADKELSCDFDKGVRALKNVKSIINRKNRQNEIDKLFLENYPAVLALAENAADTLKDCGLSQTYAYGTPKEENFVISAGGITLTNWNSLKTAHFLEDTAYFVKRCFKKVKPPVLEKAVILAAYTNENPLSAAEENVLDCILSYPEKYISVAKEYYGRHRPFAPVYVREKLNKELAALGLK